MIRISDEVQTALNAGAAVVALETTLVAHGFPPGEGVAVGLASEAAVRASGSVPATIGVLDGEIVVGLGEAELERFDASARKLGPRDLAAAVVQGAPGATTVGGTLAVAAATGIGLMATGGLGGVHRGWPTPPDVSADLRALANTKALVVSSGVKSLLDVPATSDRRSLRASSRPRRRRGSLRRTGRSAAAAFCSVGRPTRASTTSSR